MFFGICCPLARPAPVPYIATVWDLAHRCLPLFPEVSIIGRGLEWQIGRTIIAGFYRARVVC